MTSRLFAAILIFIAAAHIALAETAPASTAPAPAAATGSVTAPIPASEIRAVLDQVQSVIHAQSVQLDDQRRQIERQQGEIEDLRRQISAAQSANPAAQERAIVAAPAPEREQAQEQVQVQAQEQDAATSVALLSSQASLLKTASSSQETAPVLLPVVSAAQAPRRGAGTESSEAPLSIHFGQGSLTPGGWVDLTAYYRSTDVGSGLGTSFGSIPYNNTVAGGLSEARFTAQSSRISLRADEVFGSTKVFGYAEADFNGYLPSNAYVSTNSDTLRLRVYFTDVSRGRWEVLGGQSWSLLTPNRVGVSPFLSEIYNTLHLDTNYQVGLTYARQAQLRGVYHFNENMAFGLSLENPEQFSGAAATFPSLFSTSETDLSSSSGSGGGTATPTLHPDIIAKLSADTGWGPRRGHFEIAGLLTPVEIITPASITKSVSYKDIHEGAGISSSANLAVVKNLHLILAGFWSDGGGRYMGGLGPGFVVEQVGSKTSPFQAQLVHSGSGIASAEWQATPRNMFEFSYSGAYYDRVFSVDPATGNLVGYGFIGSAGTNNRAIQEATIATQTTLWKQRGYGSVQILTQSSYITRAPWYAAPLTPKDAHAFVGYANLRYVLP